jgi:hypothetical protein
MQDSASRAQHYHDLAFEFLVMTRFTSAADVRDTYQMMGQHYLARAGAELTLAQQHEALARMEHGGACE